ncbi:glycosyl hydrolase family 28 protein [Klebsiella oxytoca]|uniref:glycosyl hydrolase family 28 protein n=1 Tax=Klebsiella oxytoca TaxID=571 RepID=UPI002FF56AA1
MNPKIMKKSIDRRFLLKRLSLLILFLPTLVKAKNNKDNGKHQFLDFNKTLGNSNLDDHYYPLQKAINFCAKNSYILRLSGQYVISRTLNLPSNIKIVGENNAIIRGFRNIPLTLIQAENKEKISICGVTIDGNIIDGIKKSYKRASRFISCSYIHLDDFIVMNSADWAISFEKCSNIIIKNVSVTGGGRGLPGGRDGLHFLDTSNVDLDGADITSGDDCIAITSESESIENINIRNVSGSSDIGSIVIYNEEQYKNKKYAIGKISNLKIRNVTVKKNGNARDIVRVFAYNPQTSIKDVSIINVSGESKNHGVYVGGVSNLMLENINVVSTRQNGIYIVNSYKVIINNANGLASAEKHFGLSIYNSKDINATKIPENINAQNRLSIAKSENIKIAK